MHPVRKKRLSIIVLILVGVGAAVALALAALSQNINLFYTPTEIAGGAAPLETRIRAGGMVVDGSVVRSQTDLKVAFDLSDGETAITVTYDGILPDLFREGQGIVALGRLNEERVLVADEVLAKHDEEYMPPEVAQAMAEAMERVNQSKADGAEASSGYSY